MRRLADMNASTRRLALLRNGPLLTLVMGILCSVNPSLADESPAWNFSSPPDAQGLLGQAGAQGLEAGQADLGLSLTRTYNLLTTPGVPEDWSQDRFMRTQLDLSAAWAPWSFLHLGASFPLLIDSEPRILLPLEGTLADQLITGLGDLQLRSRLVLRRQGPRYPARGGPYAIALFLGGRLPTAGTLPGTGYAGLDGGFLLEGGNPFHRFVQLRAEVLQPVHTQETLSGRLHAHLGARVPIVPWTWEATLELHATGNLFPTPFKEEAAMLEVIAGVRRRTLSGWSLHTGAAAGWSPSGEVHWRILASVHRQLPPASVDRDEDLVPDWRDQCMLHPEDRDTFQDTDGCPELDNDQDGLADNMDRCPFDAEDRDNFRDLDGCPDLDNDSDNVPDLRDGCPLQPEDVDQFEDEDGCPDPDNDQDTLADAKDRCPNQAEDRDRYQDEDGCPDPDNDGDGILDNADKCPLEPEEKDGFQDDDGCPDPDNDQDTLLDGEDLCPEEAEDNLDALIPDGCPVHRRIVYREDRLILLTSPYFDPAAGYVLPRSARLIEELAQLLLQEPPETLFFVEAYVEARGNSALNAQTTNIRARALTQGLVRAGVPAARLVAVGYGEQASPILLPGAGAQLIFPFQVRLERPRQKAPHPKP